MTETVGRPTLLTIDLVNKIVKKVRSGAPVNIAAAEMGVVRRNLTNWLQHGRQDQQLEKDSVYRELLEGIEIARAEVISEWVTKGIGKLDGQWTGLKDIVLWLERNDPENFRRRETQEVISTISQRTTVEHLISPEEELGKLGRTIAILEEQGYLPRLEIPRASESIIDAEVDEVHPPQAGAEASDIPQPD